MFLESPVNLPAATLKIAEDEEGTTKRSYNHKKSKAGAQNLEHKIVEWYAYSNKEDFLGFLLSDWISKGKQSKLWFPNVYLYKINKFTTTEITQSDYCFAVVVRILVTNVKHYLAPGSKDWCAGDSPFVIAFKLLIFSCHCFISVIWSCILRSMSKLILL